jgi:hypothetical protein
MKPYGRQNHEVDERHPLITGSDFTGKRVYSKAGDDIGEKDVLISMRSIDMQRDGNNVKLVVDATKEILTSAPTYDRTKRTYMVN